MAQENVRGRDLVFSPNEFGYVSDQTTGNVKVIVGPDKYAMEETDKPMLFDNSSKPPMFQPVHLDRAKQLFQIAPEGWYIVLKNPSTDQEGGLRFPSKGRTPDLPDLNIGEKIIIPGPVSFPLWPGQMARVIKGHHLRSNQYLVVRIYEEAQARANWAKGIVKSKSTEPVKPPKLDGTNLPEGEIEVSKEPEIIQVTDVNLDNITMGKLFVVKGTDVSFYIPPTGVEVVQESSKRYVREAVTLERLEYCILKDESGNKRYVKGPDVVFPTPTETFILGKNDARKFRAIELSPISGLYLKVISDYQEKAKAYEMGEELFITGKDQMIYFPREEHAIIRYGKQNRHFAVEIPTGETRYALDRLKGEINLKKGPMMYLPDPRSEVVVRRILEDKTVNLWYPGNRMALEYNQTLRAIQEQGSTDQFVEDSQYQKSKRRGIPSQSATAMASAFSDRAYQTDQNLSGEVMADDFERKKTYTPPRTITLDTKFDGAPRIDIWTGYAIQVVNASGQRKVIQGPNTHHMEYDETLEFMALSTGKPKTTDNLYETAYLRVLHNKVSDTINAESKDLCNVKIKLSYRVNFTGPEEKWFSVENYVKFLTDHLRSVLRGVTKQYPVEKFYEDSITIIRDAILGEQGFTAKDEQEVRTPRPGKLFEENGMQVYDVEVLDVIIGNPEIADLLVGNQNDIVRDNLYVAKEKRSYETTDTVEGLHRQVADAKNQTKVKSIQLEGEIQNEEDAKELAKQDRQILIRSERLKLVEATETLYDAEGARELVRIKEKENQALSFETARERVKTETLGKETEFFVSRAASLTDKMVAAMQEFSDKDLLAKASKSMGPLAILGGKNIAEVVNHMFVGTKLENLIKKKVDPGMD